MHHLKRILITSVIQIWNKIIAFVYLKFFKNQFFQNSPNNLEDFWRTRANFLTVGQDMLKLTVLPLSQYNF